MPDRWWRGAASLGLNGCLIVLAACAGSNAATLANAHAGAGSAVPPPAANASAGPAGLPALPAPSALLARLAPAAGARPRAASYVEADLLQLGAAFDTALPHAQAVANFTSVDLAPSMSPQSGLAGLAYCTYHFHVTSYDRNDQLRLQWMTPPAQVSDSFVALANWGANRWDWYSGTATGNISTAPLATYFNFASDLLVIVALTGSTPATLADLRLGGPPPTAALSVSPTTGAVPISLHLDASASTTPDGTLTRFEWDFDGDGSFDQDTGSSAVLDHEFDTGGDIEVGVRVTNSFNAASSATQTVSLTGPWSHTLGGASFEELQSSAFDSGNDIYACGDTTDPRPSGDVDLLLLTKWSPTGKLLWAKTWDSGFAGAYGRQVRVDSAGDLVVAGWVRLDGGELRALLQKWTSGGTLSWSYTFRDSSTAHIAFEALGVDGTDIYAAGSGPDYSGAPGPLTMRLDAAGTPQWQYVYNTIPSDTARDLALRWTFTTGTNALLVLVRFNSPDIGSAILQFGLDGGLQANEILGQSGVDLEPRGLLVSENPITYHSDIFVGGEISNGSNTGVFLSKCDGSYNIESQSAWYGANVASALRLLFGASDDVYLTGFMPGLDVGSVYGMVWHFSYSDASLLDAGYWSNGPLRSAFYGIGWYQGGMLLAGQADTASGGWGTLTGGTSTPAGSWSTYYGNLVATSLTQDARAGEVADFTGFTLDAGGGGYDGLLLWRPMS